MKQLNRRDAVKLATILAVGAGPLAAENAAEDKPKSAEQGEFDATLERALSSPTHFMFSEQLTLELAGDGHSRDLYFTSARDVHGKKTKVHVPSMSMRIFRADASHDSFTEQGGVYWRFWNTDGKVQFKRPGALVMVIREQNAVRCYALALDFRC